VSHVSEPHLKLGRRVECYKQGSFHGKRGNVADIMCGGEIAKVVFDDGTTLVDSATHFEMV
jgi:hypothetical protein